MIDINNFNQDNIIIKKTKELPNAQLYSIDYENDKIIFPVNNVKIPFGLEKYYNDYLIKIPLNSEIIKSLVNKIEDKISPMDKNKFKSQIRKSQNYEDLLTVKIINNKNEISIKKYDNSLATIFDINKNSIINLIIFIDLVWSGKDSLVAKFKTKDIHIL